MMKDEQTWLKEALQDKDLQMAIMATAGCGWSSYLAEGELPFYPKATPTWRMPWSASCLSGKRSCLEASLPPAHVVLAHEPADITGTP